MRRWNGWGEQSLSFPLPDRAHRFLETRLGRLQPDPDAPWTQVLEGVPASRLAGFSTLITEPEDLLLHARGQSLPDWIALRSGAIRSYPDAVAYPGCADDIHELLEMASGSGIHLIPYGGGTSVLGHINPIPQAAPVVTVDMTRMHSLLDLDATSGLATFEAGIRGPELEKCLASHGFTLGHYPQSFEYSTLGGWIATRSTGQQSMAYGRIETLFAGGKVVTPAGVMCLKPLPASAAGPDLKEVILGSEGRFGFITEAIVRIRPKPRAEAFYGAFFKSWERGLEAVRQAAWRDFRISMLRLSDPLETEVNLLLSGRQSQVDWGQRVLRRMGYGDDRCLLIFGISTSRGSLRHAQREVFRHFRHYGGLVVGTFIGRSWQKNRFRTPYLRNSLWDAGVAVDTLETALPWNVLPGALPAIRTAIEKSQEDRGYRVMVLAHLSHVYRDGASLYFTILFPRRSDPDELLARWQSMKAAASQTILQHGGTISHQHGVGLDHNPYLETEKGPAGMALLRAICREIDPLGLMNPGKLLQMEESHPPVDKYPLPANSNSRVADDLE